jgi:hypothetical protein
LSSGKVFIYVEGIKEDASLGCKGDEAYLYKTVVVLNGLSVRIGKEGRTGQTVKDRTS